MAALSNDQVSVQKLKLIPPTLDELCYGLGNGLKSYFAQVKTEIVNCPNLKKKPYNLAASGIVSTEHPKSNLILGLCGNGRVIQVGDASYVMPTSKLDRVYDFKNIADIIGMKDGFIIGSTGGMWPYPNKFSTMVANCVIKDNEIKCYTKSMFVVNDNSDDMDLIVAPENETRFAMQGDLYSSDGHPGKVVKIICKQRIADSSFTNAVSSVLRAEFRNPVGLGVVFRVHNGTVKTHVGRDFLNNAPKDTWNDYLNFYNVSNGFVAVGTIVTEDLEELKIQNEHLHGYTDGNLGGHYHYDITPETVEYEAFVYPADMMYVVDESDNSIPFSVAFAES